MMGIYRKREFSRVELGVQMIETEDEFMFDIDVLDARDFGQKRLCRVKLLER